MRSIDEPGQLDSVNNFFLHNVLIWCLVVYSSAHSDAVAGQEYNVTSPKSFDLFLPFGKNYVTPFYWYSFYTEIQKVYFYPCKFYRE